MPNTIMLSNKLGEYETSIIEVNIYSIVYENEVEYKICANNVMEAIEKTIHMDWNQDYQFINCIKYIGINGDKKCPLEK